LLRSWRSEFFLLPGLNATWILERLAGRTTLRPTERLFRAIAFSVVVYALASPWLLRLAHRALEHRKIWPWEPIIGFSLLVFLIPALGGIGWVKLRTWEQFKRLVRRLTNIDPSPTSWDFVLGKGQAYLIRAKLRDGERVAGLFGPNSNASLYPEAQDLYMEQAWRLDEEGRFMQALEGSRGLLLRREDADIIEFLEVRVMEVNQNGEDS
jgi:hypothetical protein